MNLPSKHRKNDTSQRCSILDFEASGLDEASYPIEVAVWQSGQVHAWLILPEPSWQYWCKTAESMHGITRDELQQYGKPAATVAMELNAVISTNVVFSDAANWDDFWLRRLYTAANMTPSFEIASIFMLLDESERDIFLQQKDKLARSGIYRHHRAGEDVKLIRQAYLNTIELR
ncbi:hypothetical protein TDB9533_03929 [Thalassocella blandensis]|nr:hypothetical protein TDB9533_03929 [Thalassocella blandensis]